ncbi:MAG: hypothetical protein U1A27_10950 [Phycisphaerae bacterium]
MTKVNARDRTGSWPEPFKTEGPIFAKPALSRDLLFVSSTDRPSMPCGPPTAGGRGDSGSTPSW